MKDFEIFSGLSGFSPKEKACIIIDGGYYWSRQSKSRFDILPEKAENLVQNDCKHLIKLCKKKSKIKLSKIYYCDGIYPEDNEKHEKERRWSKNFFYLLKQKNKIKVRFQPLQYDEHYKSYKQKGVDGEIYISAFKAIEKGYKCIILVSNDNDFVPLSKYVQDKGVRFIVCPLDNLLISKLQSGATDTVNIF